MYSEWLFSPLHEHRAPPTFDILSLPLIVSGKSGITLFNPSEVRYQMCAPSRVKAVKNIKLTRCSTVYSEGKGALMQPLDCCCAAHKNVQGDMTCTRITLTFSLHTCEYMYHLASETLAIRDMSE